MIKASSLPRGRLTAKKKPAVVASETETCRQNRVRSLLVLFPKINEHGASERKECEVAQWQKRELKRNVWERRGLV